MIYPYHPCMIYLPTFDYIWWNFLVNVGTLNLPYMDAMGYHSKSLRGFQGILQSDCPCRYGRQDFLERFIAQDFHRRAIVLMGEPDKSYRHLSCSEVTNLHIFRWFISKLPIPSISMMTSKVSKLGGYTFQLLLSMAFEDSLVVSILYEVWSRKTGETEAEFESHDCWTVLTETVGRSGIQSRPCWLKWLGQGCDRAGKLRRVYPNEDASRERFWASEVFLIWESVHLVADFFFQKSEASVISSPLTPPKFNITSGNQWLEDQFPFGMAYFHLFSGANC